MRTETLLAGRYRVGARLGGGGMADVYAARDELVDRTVAVKVLRGVDDRIAARRFAAEVRHTGRVTHPAIVRLLDAGEADGAPFLVLEHIEGGTLSSALADGPLPSDDVARMGVALASALAAAHAAGIVHRDVKPPNILLDERGPHLADFGIAVTATATRLTVAGQIAGSPGYVSPEQVLGEDVGPPADIYALGLVLLEALTGRPAFTGTAVEAALVRLNQDPLIPAELGAHWNAVLSAMTSRRPGDRPSAGEAVDLLGAIADGDSTRLAGLTPIPRDHRVPALAASVLVIAGIGIVTLLGGGAQPEALATGRTGPPPAATADVSLPTGPHPAVTSTAASSQAAPVVTQDLRDWADRQRATQERQARKARAKAEAEQSRRQRTAAQPQDRARRSAPKASAAEKAVTRRPTTAPKSTTGSTTAQPKDDVEQDDVEQDDVKVGGGKSNARAEKAKGRRFDLPEAALRNR